MKRIILLAVMGCLSLGGWASARQIELLNHNDEAQSEPMQNAGCSASSSCGCGGQ